VTMNQIPQQQAFRIPLIDVMNILHPIHLKSLIDRHYVGSDGMSLQNNTDGDYHLNEAQ
jgi:hypothetical protein